MSGSWARRSTYGVVAQWAAASALSIAAGVLSAAAARPVESYVALAVSGLVYAAAGAVAAGRQPTNPIGWALMTSTVLNAALVTLRYLVPVTLPLNVAFGTQAAVIPLVFVVLTFPSGRIADTGSKWLLAAVVVAGIGGGALELISVEPAVALAPAVCAPCTSNPARLLDPTLYAVFQDLNALTLIGLAIAVIALIAVKWRRSRGLTRAALAPLIGGAVVLGLIYVSLFVLALMTNDVPAFAGPLLLVARLLIPIALVAVFLRFYSARAAVARALLRIGRGSSVAVI